MRDQPSGGRLRQSVRQRERLGRLLVLVRVLLMRSRRTRAARRLLGVRAGRQRTQRHAARPLQLRAWLARGAACRWGKAALRRRARAAVPRLIGPRPGCRLNRSHQMGGCASRRRRRAEMGRRKVALVLAGLALTRVLLVLVLMMQAVLEPVPAFPPVTPHPVRSLGPAHWVQQWPVLA